MKSIDISECTITINKPHSMDHILFKVNLPRGPYKPFDQTTTNCLRMEAQKDHGIDYVVYSLGIDTNIIKIFDWQSGKKCSYENYITN